MSEAYKYERYINANQETRWATIEDIQNSGMEIDLNAKSYPGAGLPLFSNTKTAYVDNGDSHTLIFGATGSKKTRLFCMPMINFFANADESFIVTDPKGELYKKTSGLVNEKGYKTVVLNFRDIGKGDMWNPLALPYALYNSGNKEDAISLLNDFVSTIAEPTTKNTHDSFWPEMASSLALANLYLLMDSAAQDECHIGSFAKLCSGESMDSLSKLTELIDENSIAGMNYRGVFVSADTTQKSIFVSLYAMIRIFITQQSLTKMLSGNTFDIRNFGKEKTAVYIIVPDEKTTYHFLVTTFIKQVYEILIYEAQKEKTLKLPVRVNFVLDEFCNIPKIPDMPSMISAARSRNMRYYLIAQSLHQMRGKYGEDADTIKGNCDNWVFLTSKELSLLNEISELCGTIRTADNREKRLISVSELQRFNKEKGEVLIMHSRQYPMVTEMPDIDEYEMFKGHKSIGLVPFALPEIKNFSVGALIKGITNKTIPVPFSVKKTETAETPVHSYDEKAEAKEPDVFGFDLQAQLEQKFDELFGANS